MHDEIRSLIESLRLGQYDDPREKIALLAAALREHAADAALIVTLLRAPQVSLRLAALEACRGRGVQGIAAALREMVRDGEARVRAKLAEIIRTLSEMPVAATLATLAEDSAAEVRQQAISASTGLAGFRARQGAVLTGDPEWTVRQAAASALAEQPAPDVVKELMQALGTDSDRDVQQHCAEALEKRLTQQRAAAEPHLPTDGALLLKAERALTALNGRYPVLAAWLSERTTAAVDVQRLGEFGTDLTALAATGVLPRAHEISQAVTDLLAMLDVDKPASIALVGEAGVGKTALVNELVYGLNTRTRSGWRVLRISPTDIMSGTRYLGEWETKVRSLIDVVRRPRRVILYVPNLGDLSMAGRSSVSETNVASALAPYIEDGSIVLVGESTPAEFDRRLGAVPSLRRLFGKVVVPAATADRTRRILKAVGDDHGVALADAVLDTIVDVSTMFLGHIARPGNAVAVLRAALAEPRTRGIPLTPRDVLAALSRSSGMPVDLLDDAVPLDGHALRAFFDERILGQPEAVAAVVDVVTLIKAGLTDPHKPFGVFLFVGPTGVGKTELARALAEFIFGDAGRLVRLDMSEYANPAAFERLIGGRDDAGVLTEAVRQHPFSVVLLDEIEKSHLNVFDLCLQIFDAGRLTDGLGRTIDFRRTIVILTSNIGAEAPATPLGFGATPSPGEGQGERTQRELSRFFRPEFLNRLDRIVNFRPLSLEVAERITRREIDLVLQRVGITRRGLAIDVDPSVVSLLVKEGYSPHFGARPLKRTVERLVLLPLARAIAGGQVSGKDVLRLFQRDGRVEVRVDRAASAAPVDVEAPRPGPLAAELGQLREALAALEPSVTALRERKTALLERTAGGSLHHDRAARVAVLDQIHKLDQFLARHRGLSSALEQLGERAGRVRTAPAEESRLRERMEQLAIELDDVRRAATSRDARELGDAIVVLSLVDRDGGDQRGVATLARMYLALARRRRLEAEELGELYDGKRDTAWLSVSGLGAYGVLRGEAGLHQLDRKWKERRSRSGREVVREDREIVRVDVHPLLGEPDPGFRAQIKATTQPLKPPRTRLIAKADVAVSLFHQASLRSLTVWMRGPRDAAIERAYTVLWAETSAADGREEQPGIVRYYDLGEGARVRDVRSGRVTSRVDHVLRGRLDQFWGLPAERPD
jgi:ATP-dependent Clp protease ATP-binding subunit ClpC